MNTQNLRTLVGNRIDVRWSDFAQRHPHLAEAIDRVRLTDSAVKLLSEDPEFLEAMRQADLSEAQLGTAAGLLERAEKVVRRLLAI